MLHGGADREDLGQVLPPLVAADVEPHADDAVGAQLVSLLFHPRHRELTRLVHRLGEHLHLHRLLPARLLVTDVVDRAADHEAKRIETRLLDEQELVDGQIRCKEASLHLGEALASVLGHAFGRGRVVAHLLPPKTCGESESLRSSICGDTSRWRPSARCSPIAVPITWKVTTRSVRRDPPRSISRSSALCSIETTTTPAGPIVRASALMRP